MLRRSSSYAASSRRTTLIDIAPLYGACARDHAPDGHRGFVLAGEIEYEFDDGSTLLAREGQGFWLAGGTGHRGRNPGDTVARLFLIDDPV
jgi:quercetin dioxygenase-like cupin family protein